MHTLLELYPHYPFRRDWGHPHSTIITELSVALDALTPAYDDHTLRLLSPTESRTHYELAITAYASMEDRTVVIPTLLLQLSCPLVESLIEAGHLIRIDAITPMVDGAPKRQTFYIISDSGEAAWRQTIFN